MTRRFLVTGGAGFVGSTVALRLKREYSDAEVIAFDNLYRKGSELNLPRLEAGGVAFREGDVRHKESLDAVGAVDCLIECSAEPSVMAGVDESPEYLVETNLVGAFNCLEHLRRHGGDLVFVSTSRVYPVEALRDLPLEVVGKRLEIAAGAGGPGWSVNGIAEDFPMDGHRTLYGATKLSAEHLVLEYGQTYGIRAVLDRCGVLCGPWQMGRVDQGFVALWVARHEYGLPLTYIGHGGTGHQVRDLLHVEDFCDLLVEQLGDMDAFAGAPLNVGGGREVSVSLVELTEMCREITGKRVEIGRSPETRAGDIPYYVSDCTRLSGLSDWRPKRAPAEIVEDAYRWIADNRKLLEPVFHIKEG